MILLRWLCGLLARLLLVLWIIFLGVMLGHAWDLAAPPIGRALGLRW